MRILYVTFVLCVAALLVSVLAAARHIRRHEEKRRAAVEEDPAASGEVAHSDKLLVQASRARGD
jgi:hypothetical protein